MPTLVDTHVLLWWLTDDKRLGAQARKAISQASRTHYVSSISLAEIHLKSRSGKLTAIPDLATLIVQEGFAHLAFDHVSASETLTMPELNWRDPFDALLMAQSVAEECVLLTADKNILQCEWQRLRLQDAKQ